MTEYFVHTKEDGEDYFEILDLDEIIKPENAMEILPIEYSEEMEEIWDKACFATSKEEQMNWQDYDEFCESFFTLYFEAKGLIKLDEYKKQSCSSWLSGLLLKGANESNKLLTDFINATIKHFGLQHLDTTTEYFLGHVLKYSYGIKLKDKHLQETL